MSGLGLAQVYSFAQQSGGSVDVRSEEPGRAAPPLRSTLPQSSDGMMTFQRDRSPGRVQSRRAKARTFIFLLVEDNAEVAEVGQCSSSSVATR